MLFRPALLFTGALVFAQAAFAQITTTPKQGLRENDPRVHALTNARIVTAPGEAIDKGEWWAVCLAATNPQTWPHQSHAESRPVVDRERIRAG